MPFQEDTVEMIELEVLRGLCAHPSGEEYEKYAAGLGNYNWRDAEHRVVYEAVRRIGFLPPVARCRELPAEVTRRGFPDIDCSAYFVSEPATPEELPKLILRLQKLPR